MNPLIESYFAHRGIDEEYLLSIDEGTHDELASIDELVEALHDLDGRCLVLYTDYDTDGIMSGVLGFAGLSQLGFNVHLFQPLPSEGYGLSELDAERILEAHPDVAAVITADVGTTSYDGVSYLEQRGVSVWVTDHHSEVDASRRVASILVNPMRVDETYENPQICGAYVLYQVLEAYAACYGTFEQQEDISRLKVFAGLGTIGDMMPLLYENRVLVKDALSIYRSIGFFEDYTWLESLEGHPAYKSAFRGLSVVARAFYGLGKLEGVDDINEEFIGFYVSPLFNSVRRLGLPLTPVYRLFFGDESEQRIACVKLLEINDERKAIVEDAVARLYEREQPFAPHIYLTDVAYDGIIGLLAGRIVHESGLPVLVVKEQGDGSYAGSGRSPAWYPARSTISGWGASALGHEHAFGVAVSDEEDLAALAAYLVDDLRGFEGSSHEPTYDFHIAFDEYPFSVYRGYIRALERYRPFGAGFEKPVGRIDVDSSDIDVSVIGKKGVHLKLRATNGLEILCWSQADLKDRIESSSRVSIVGDFKLNTYMGRESVNFVGDVIW